MALCACGRLLRGGALLSRRLVASSRQEIGPKLPQAGGATCSRGRLNGLFFTPACAITSEGFLNRLTMGKPAESSSLRLPAPVPSDDVDQTSLLMRNPDQPQNPKVLKVAIIGAPNAGKSTLSNQLLGRKVFAVSRKVHTTRCRALGVLTENNSQIVLLDTPGFTTASKVKRHNLEKSLLVDPWNTVKEADLLVVVVDVADRWMCSQLPLEVRKCLAQNSNIPAILVLNKVDLVKSKNRLLDVTAHLTCGVVNGRKIRVRPVIKPPWAEKRPQPAPQDEEEQESDNGDTSGPVKEKLKELRGQQGWAHFKDVFMLSSVDKDNVETLKQYFLVEAKPGPWPYHSEVLTDQSPQDLCLNLIRERLLEYLPQEVPYTITQAIEAWREDENGYLLIHVVLGTQKESHKKLIIGPGGERVACISRQAGEDLSVLFLRDVRLKITIKSQK